ncbi:uncharacterized protein TNCV_1788071 [Trichonephila clavipes]|nr:uncharacterized protein TNCV_1788071 [Trichonephila clavipes]
MAPLQPRGMSMTSCNHMCCHSCNGSKEPFFNKTMLGLTRQECHKTVSALLLSFFRLPDPQMCLIRAYAGSFGTSAANGCSSDVLNHQNRHWSFRSWSLAEGNMDSMHDAANGNGRAMPRRYRTGCIRHIGAQIPMVRADVVEGQIIDNRGTIQITSAFGEHEMGELKDSGMEINDLSHGVVPISKNLVNDMLICSSDYEGLIENSQLVGVEITALNVQLNGQGMKESKRKVDLSVDLLDSKNNFIFSGSIVKCWKSNVIIILLNDSDEHMKNQFQTYGITANLPNIVITLKRRGNVTDFVISRKPLSFVGGVRVVCTMGTTPK